MIYEWYSGLDSSGRVVRIVAKLNTRCDEMSDEERVRAFQEALRLEPDPNWKGYLLSRLATAYELAAELDKAGATYAEAASTFDPFAANFLDVVESYCFCLEGLIRRRLTGEDVRPDELASAALSTLLFADMTEIEGSVRATVFAWLARSLTSLGYRTGEKVFHRLALPAALRAHHIEPEDPAFLRELVYCYFNLGMADKCREAFEAYLEVAEPGEAKDAVVAFVRDRLNEIMPDGDAGTA